jgi:acyl-CoA-binding protein
MTDSTDLQAAFDQARTDSQNLTERPDNMTLLKLYALYKQGSQGDNDQPRPGFSDPVARAKWDAWIGLKGLGREDAMRQYIELIGSLD